MVLGNVTAQPAQCLGYSCGSTAWEKTGADQETAELVNKAWNVRSVVGQVPGAMARHMLVSLLGLICASLQRHQARLYLQPLKVVCALGLFPLQTRGHLKSKCHINYPNLISASRSQNQAVRMVFSP